jgi:hypothetical protein
VVFGDAGAAAQGGAAIVAGAGVDLSQAGHDKAIIQQGGERPFALS